MIRINIFAIMLLIAACVDGQNPEWINYTHGDQINAMVVDGNYIWLGTSGGINCFNKSDGTTTHYTKANSGLSNNYINSMCIDSNGSLWIGNRGLIVYNRKKWTTFTKDNSILPSNIINVLVTGSDGSVWIGTIRGLVKYKNGSWTAYNRFPEHYPFHGGISVILPLEGDTVWVGFNQPKLVKMVGEEIIDSIIIGDQYFTGRIRSLFKDINGDLWISTSNGLVCHTGDSTKIFTMLNSPLPTNNITYTFRDSSGHFWIGTCCRGLIHVNDTIWTVHNPMSAKIPTSCFTQMVMEKKNNFWIASEAGLLEFDQGNWTRHNTANSGLSYFDERINVITTDLEGTTWVGTNVGIYGLHEDQSWTCPSYDSIFNYYTTLWAENMVVDHNNVLWISSTQAQLLSLENGSYKKHDLFHMGGPWGRISSMAIGPEGKLWFIIQDHLYRYDGISCLLFDKSNSGFTDAKSPIVTSDHNNVLWITDHGKVTRYDGRTWTTYDQSNSPLPDDRFLNAVTDTAGVLWIGSRNNGLIRFDGDFWDVYSPANSAFPLEHVRNLALDQENNLWATGVSRNKGAVMFDGDKITTIFTEDNSPLQSNWILSLHIDNANKKWFGMASRNGIAVYNYSVTWFEEDNHQILKDPVVNLWPNPFSEYFKVEVPTPCYDCFYQIKDMSGRIFMEGEISGRPFARINTGMIPPGIYIFSMTDGGNCNFSQKIVKRF